MKKTFTVGMATAMLLTLGLAMEFALVSSASAAEPSYNTTTFPFGTHITMGLPEQDIYVKHDGSSPDQVFRVAPAEAMSQAVLDQQVYAAGAVQQHDPFGLGPNPMGPYPSGEPLGFTMRQWLSAGGDVTYGCANGRSTVSARLRNLVPDGQYTLWYSRLTFPPNLEVVNRPIGASDGSQNSFKADASGNATFNLTFPGCLEQTTKETATLIITAYHSDGKTYGSSPGDFGRVTHLQNVAVIGPPVAASASPGGTGMPRTGAGSESMGGPEDLVSIPSPAGLVVALLCVLIGASVLRRARS